MNYYIQGNKEKAEEIKAAFEKLGIDVLDFGFADKTVVYCSIGGACVQSLPYGINLMHILHSHPDYQELELPVQPKFKVGDWLYHNKNGDYPILITDYDENLGYQTECLSAKTYLRQEFVEKEYHLWSIEDAKDGDVLATTIGSCPFIYRKTRYNNDLAYYYAGIDVNGNFTHNEPLYHFGSVENAVPATREQRDILFRKMKDAGFKWDADKKELRKIKHYDISSFHEGMPVLVRDSNDDEWNYLLFSHYRKKMPDHFFAGGNPWYECIPFEGNEHLLGTTDMCNEQYVNW